MKIKGRAHKYGDDIDTDVITPGRYLNGPLEELKKHVMEVINPRFPQEVKNGDIALPVAEVTLSGRKVLITTVNYFGVDSTPDVTLVKDVYDPSFNYLKAPVTVRAIDGIKPEVKQITIRLEKGWNLSLIHI